jgi:hypothetical protein
MNRAVWFRAGFRSLVAGSALALATAASAADGWVTLPFTPFQLAIAPGAAQVFSKPTPVYGLRVSALYGIQSKVVGFDVGLFNDADSLTGVGVGFCNVTRGNAAGAHLGVGCNYSEADFAGLQTGVVNQVGGQLAGFQLGLANGSEGGAGLQIGLVNYSNSMRGVQLGLLNWNDNGFLPFFPFVNFGF